MAKKKVFPDSEWQKFSPEESLLPPESLPPCGVGCCLDTFERLFAKSHTMFLAYSLKGERHRANPAFTRHFDLTELKSFYHIFRTDQRHLVEEALNRHGRYEGHLSLAIPQGEATAFVKLEYLRQRGEPPSHILMIAEPSQEELFYNATHDTLTRLPNRFYFKQKLQEAILRAERNGTEGALFFIDLDNFKSVNDSLGHEAGDAVLIEAAARLKRLLRSTDMVARYGGDEFLLLMEPIKDREAPLYLAERIVESFNEPFTVRSSSYRIGTSIGIALFPKDASDVETLIKHADASMYRAKREGKHSFYFYSDRIDYDIKHYYLVERAIMQALRENRLYLLFQPQIDITIKRIVAFEALLRMEPTEIGAIPPAEFIPVAEKSDLIIWLGRWVLEECCRQLKAWQAYPQTKHLVISINLSYRQLMDANWYDFMMATLGRFGVDPSRIEFEVSEESLIRAGEAGLETMEKIHAAGCSLSIDDFGSGYSSLSDLRRFAFKKLKIDRNFIKNLDDTLHRDIVKASVAMANALGLETLAKGVESREQARLLTDLGCTEMQGYLYGRPLRESEIPEILTNQES